MHAYQYASSIFTPHHPSLPLSFPLPFLVLGAGVGKHPCFNLFWNRNYSFP